MVGPSAGSDRAGRPRKTKFPEGDKDSSQRLNLRFFSSQFNPWKRSKTSPSISSDSEASQLPFPESLSHETMPETFTQIGQREWTSGGSGVSSFPRRNGFKQRRR